MATHKVIKDTDLGIYMDYNGIESGKLNPLLPAINSTPILFTPSSTGNITNRNEIVFDPFGYKWYIDYAGDAVLLDNPKQIIAQSTIVTHLNAIADTTTNALTEDVILPYDGNYILTLSFNYNVDANNSYGKVYSTLGGNALDLNDRSSVIQGNNQILVVEVKDNLPSSGGEITGTASGLKMPFSMQFFLTGQIAGTYPFIIDIGCESSNVETSIWNIIAKFEFIN